MKVALIHRYDNKPDILAVKENGCSEVYRRSRTDNFDLVVVIPTVAAKTSLAVYGETTSGQYVPPQAKSWPGKPDKYPIRVDMTNIQETTLKRVRHAVDLAGGSWAGQWTVRVFPLDETVL